jgi:hypothetical protein
MGKIRQRRRYKRNNEQACDKGPSAGYILAPASNHRVKFKLFSFIFFKISFNKRSDIE